MKVKQQGNKATSAMGQLLASHKDLFTPLHKGDIVTGTITKLISSEILVDIGAKTTAVVLEKERSILHTYLSVFREGDTVQVLILTPESEAGQPVVSLRRHLGDISWKRLEKLAESHELIEAEVSDVTKAGYVVVTSFGSSGFLPQSHVSFAGNQTISVGDTLSVMVHELNRKDNKIIFSQKPIFSDEDFSKLISKFKPDQKVKVTLTNVTSFGLFVTLPVSGSSIPLEGFVHISEVAWDKTAELQHLFAAGQEIDAVIVKFDMENKKVQLSIKRLTKDPFDEIMDTYPLEKQVSAIVVSVEDGGVSLRLDDKVEGYMRKEKIPPTVSYTEGQKVTVLVSEYDKRRKRIYVVPVLLKKAIGYR
jgi:ribosomal protein S1